MTSRSEQLHENIRTSRLARDVRALNKACGDDGSGVTTVRVKARRSKVNRQAAAMQFCEDISAHLSELDVMVRTPKMQYSTIIDKTSKIRAMLYAIENQFEE